MNNKTTIGGLLSSIGKGLTGAGVLTQLTQLFPGDAKIPAGILVAVWWVTLAGVILGVVGTAITGYYAADKPSVPVNPNAKPPTLPPMGLSVLLGTLAIASVFAFAGLGCKSTSANLGVVTATVNTNGVLYLGSTPVDPAEVGLGVKLGAKYGAQALLKQNPASREYLTIAVGVINAAIISKNYDPAQLQGALMAAIPTADANTAVTISTAVADGLDIYRTFYGQVMSNKICDVSPYLAPSLQGLADGVSIALATTK